jgi:hypothetical protein
MLNDLLAELCEDRTWEEMDMVALASGSFLGSSGSTVCRKVTPRASGSIPDWMSKRHAS